MGLSNADSIPMLRAAGQITPEVEKMMLQNPSATYSEAVQQKMEEENAKAKESEAKAAYAQARADLAPKLAQHLNALRDAQASLASAKSAMGTKSPAAGKLFQQAQSKYITVTKSIAALNIQLGDQMKMMDAPHKQAAQDELKNLMDQQQALSAQMDELKASAQTPGASANTASVGSTPAGTVSTVQALQALLPTKPQAPAQPVQ
jgi:chromosome segregation ATPase